MAQKCNLLKIIVREHIKLRRVIQYQHTLKLQPYLYFQNSNCRLCENSVQKAWYNWAGTES